MVGLGLGVGGGKEISAGGWGVHCGNNPYQSPPSCSHVVLKCNPTDRAILSAKGH